MAGELKFITIERPVAVWAAHALVKGYARTQDRATANPERRLFARQEEAGMVRE
jgi:hypothetical protein